VTAVLLAAGGAALIAVPAGAAARSPAHTSAPASRDAATAACPWATSHAPIAQRVAQLMSHMTIPDEITMVEGQGTTNPYVFYMAGIPSLCIPAMGEEDGPVAGQPVRPGHRVRGGRQGGERQPGPDGQHRP
jgi:hypothetical protein